MYIFAGIDGTGDSNDAEYSRLFSKSFVREFTTGLSAPNIGHYQRGPSTFGGATEPRGETAANFIAPVAVARRQGGWRPGIFLTGFSRGGASAIHACRLLAERNIKVDALFLFDAVDRYVGQDVDVVPTNVRSVHHAKRDPKTDSRGSFGNCGLKHDPKFTSYNSAPFHCTHGAMGGTPWERAGWDGKIYEDHTNISKGTIILLGLATGTLSAATTYVTSLRTNVTMAQERAGSAAVHTWMTKNINYEIGQLDLCRATG
jgi:hypothetical protein